MTRARFTLGQLLATPGALRLFEQLHVDALDYVTRHVTGDWGDLNAADKRANERALVDGSRLLSRYNLTAVDRIYIITEAADDAGQRVATTILLPEEY